MKAILKTFPLFFVIIWATQTITAQTPAPTPRTLFVFGDSWSERIASGPLDVTPLNTPPLQLALAEREFDEFITWVSFAVGGTTAEQWASDELLRFTTVKTAIALDPNPNPIVFFTLGGNDLLIDGTPPTETLEDLELIFTELEAIRPDLQIVYGQYDLLNVNAPPIVPLITNCEDTYQAAFAGLEPNDAATVALGAFQQAVELVAQFERVQITDTYGSMQGRPGNPDVTKWSPVELLNDCIHLNDEGYGIYLDTTFAALLTPIICQDSAVTADACNVVPTAVQLHTTSAETTSLLPIILVLGLLLLTTIRQAHATHVLRSVAKL